ncbi:hypothetical protein T552_00883 [Pneumocystis carinii B80]|uniref:NAD+ kinase n=1 Tax=Pneumocystis carinii (strain B80) TaxID=1408658 RepID=A0A0W4ZMR6_PNEC8|nr:hypothetical protein T552_00883 [Pneumocystis carinii B80]KTW29674.1 hypothetical protein T552_00883 [Pneumocystis carinii B80]
MAERKRIRPRNSFNSDSLEKEGFKEKDKNKEYFIENKNQKKKTSLNDKIEDLETRLIESHNRKKDFDMIFNTEKGLKSLDDVRIILDIGNIIIITKAHDKSLVLLTRKLVIWLLSYQSNHEKKYNVYVESTFKDSCDFDSKNIIKLNPSFENYLKYWTFEFCNEYSSLFDFVITLGGDGTVLFGSWLFQKTVPPVLSFSLGSLGFLTMFDFSTFDTTLDNLFCNGVIISLRMRLQCTIMRVKVDDNGEPIDKTRDLDRSILNDKNCGTSLTHEPKESFSVLNDLVVDRGPNPFLSSIELYGDYEHFTSVQADGICISTPTGSTAYSLSAGGSLCHPDIPAILISPICPHTLSFRPLLVHDSMILHVAIPYDSRSTSWVSFDGRNRVEIKQGDYVTISASKFHFPIVLRSKQNSNWFTSLATRLGWNERTIKLKPLSN